MPKILSTNVRWLKYMHIEKLDNNKVGENIIPYPNTTPLPPPPPNSCLTHINQKNKMKCPPKLHFKKYKK
jgi:hypothetical protein